MCFKIQIYLNYTINIKNVFLLKTCNKIDPIICPLREEKLDITLNKTVTACCVCLSFVLLYGREIC